MLRSGFVGTGLKASLPEKTGGQRRPPRACVRLILPGAGDEQLVVSHFEFFFAALLVGTARRRPSAQRRPYGLHSTASCDPMASCLFLDVSWVSRLCVETLMAGNRLEAIQPTCSRTHDYLRIGSIFVWVRQCGGVDVGLLWPLLRPKVEPCAARGTEPSISPWTALVMFDLPIPMKLLRVHAQEGRKGRGSGALAIGTVTNKIACGFARICPRHRPTHAVA